MPLFLSLSLSLSLHFPADLQLGLWIRVFNNLEMWEREGRNDCQHFPHSEELVCLPAENDKVFSSSASYARFTSFIFASRIFRRIRLFLFTSLSARATSENGAKISPLWSAGFFLSVPVLRRDCVVTRRCALDATKEKKFNTPNVRCKCWRNRYKSDLSYHRWCNLSGVCRIAKMLEALWILLVIFLRDGEVFSRVQILGMTFRGTNFESGDAKWVPCVSENGWRWSL